MRQRRDSKTAEFHGKQWATSLKMVVSCVIVLAALVPFCWLIYSIWTETMTGVRLFVALSVLIVVSGVAEALAPRLGWKTPFNAKRAESSYLVARRLTNRTHLIVYLAVAVAVAVFIVFGNAIRSFLGREEIVTGKEIAAALAVGFVVLMCRVAYVYRKGRTRGPTTQDQNSP